MGESYTKRIFQGASTTFILSFIAAVIAYLTKVILARSLSVADYGLFSAVLAFVIFFLFLRSLGLNVALAKFIAEWKIDQQFGKIKSAILSVTLYQLLSSLIFSTIFFFLASYLAETYFHDPRAELMLQLFLIYLITSVFFTLLKGIFRGFQKMLLFSSVELVKNGLILLLVLLFFKLNLGINGPVLAYVIICPLLLLIYLIPAAKLSRFSQSKKEFFLSISKKTFLFGLPLFAVSFEGKLISHMNILILTFFSSLTEVGIFNVIQPTTVFLLFLGRAVTAIVFPISSELAARKDRQKLREGVRLLQKYLFVLVLPLVCLVMAFSREIIVLVFGNEYVSGALAMQILLIGILFYLMGMIHNDVISAMGHPKSIAYIFFFGALVSLILDFLLIPRFSIMGAALATTGGYAIILLLSARKIKKLTQSPPFLGLWIKQLIAGGLFLLSVIMVRNYFTYSFWVEGIISLIVGLVVYLIYLFSFRIVDWKEIKKYGGLL